MLAREAGLHPNQLSLRSTLPAIWSRSPRTKTSARAISACSECSLRRSMAAM